MSAIGGIYSLLDGQVDEARLLTLSRQLTMHGPDGGREVVKGSVGFCHRAFHTNAASRGEVQPLTTELGQLLCWDGRLDNRVELCRETGSRFGPDITDVELVMAAYFAWGREFASHLIGDFAFSLWDSTSRTLILGRDPIGVRTLFYRRDASEFTWASDLTSLIALSSGPASIDENYVAGFLAFQKDTDRSPFIEYKAVRPGHLVEVNCRGEVSERMFWGLNPGHEIRYARDEDYEQGFYNLFEESVRVRLRTDSPIIAELSGGLDSSAIVCMADRLIKKGIVEAPRMDLVSHVSDECRTSDERKFIHIVERHVGRTSNYLRQDDYPFLTPLNDVSRVSTINPFLTNAGYLYGLGELMKETGARIRLSGVGGDELLHSVNDPMPQLAELLRTKHYVQLAKQLRSWSTLLREPYLRLFWVKALKPNLPARLQVKFSEQDFGPPAFIDPTFAKRTQLAERMLGVRDIYGFESAIGRDQSTGFLSVVNSLALGHYPEVLDHEMSYPFLHRPLVEFLCAIPFDQLLRPGESRSLMRRSLSELLPEAILKRRGKGNPREIVSVMFARQWPIWSELFKDPLVVHYGFVNLPPLRAAIDRLRHGLVMEARHVVSVITLEVWLRINETRSRIKAV